MPEMEKTSTKRVAQQFDARTFLSHTTYSPTAWISSRPSVASVDDNGTVTVHKKGKTRITAIYEGDKGSSNKKYSTKLKVEVK